MTTDVRELTAISRRTLMVAGAGLVLGTASLVLSGSMDEAAARGSQGGKMGGRHGKDHRGRDKNRGKDRNDNGDKDNEPREDSFFGIRSVQATIINGSSQDATIMQFRCGNADPAVTVHPGERITLVSGCLTEVSANLYIREQSYHIEAENTAVGEPTVTIHNNTTDVTEFDHSFDEGEVFASDNFMAGRLTDTDDYKVFEITLF